MRERERMRRGKGSEIEIFERGKSQKISNLSLLISLTMIENMVGLRNKKLIWNNLFRMLWELFTMERTL